MKNSLKFNWNCWKRERKVEGETCLQSSRIRKYFIAFGNSILFASRWTLETLPDILLFIKIHKLWSMFDVKKFLKFPMILKKFIALSRCVLTFVVIKMSNFQYGDVSITEWNFNRFFILYTRQAPCFTNYYLFAELIAVKYCTFCIYLLDNFILWSYVRTKLFFFYLHSSTWL